MNRQYSVQHPRSVSSRGSSMTLSHRDVENGPKTTPNSLREASSLDNMKISNLAVHN